MIKSRALWANHFSVISSTIGRQSLQHLNLLWNVLWYEWCVCMCVCMWKSIHVCMVSSLVSLTYLFETESVTKPEDQWFSWLASLQSLGSFPSSPLPHNTRVTASVKHHQAFTCVLRVQGRILILAWQSLWQLRHLTSSLWNFSFANPNMYYVRCCCIKGKLNQNLCYSEKNVED